MLRYNKTITVSQISKAMELERTTIQKAIKNLLEKNLITRIQKNLPRGGYVFFYRPNNKDKIKAKMKGITYKWYKKVEEAIAKL